RGVRIVEGPQVYERVNRRVAVEALTPSGLIFGDGFRVTPGQLLVKRVLSVVIALVALVAAAPFMALVAVAIKLETPGPVFFIQERVGLNGRLFRLIKFRTMRVASAAEPDTEVRDNVSRVTRIGTFLRRYRLDEIPQFINILRGDMSLVGPRPEMAENAATFSAVIPYYNLRHEVRPGLTGWAQVRAGYSMSIEEVTRKLCYDLYYIKHMSILFDLRILFDTVKFVLSGRRPG
ncbi:MAG: exopolysaccharide biosynthesis polyprenyl glycosylphosphotransferase, partial [Candidatus Rokubacteria bacterium]|nr:exopolysaccharide biosynthesis polyprenyl glycosylphosphotransferase [Candidatus Rokubacteria bacterium]